MLSEHAPAHDRRRGKVHLLLCAYFPIFFQLLYNFIHKEEYYVLHHFTSINFDYLFLTLSPNHDRREAFEEVVLRKLEPRSK
jgi:hypothetical protein